MLLGKLPNVLQINLDLYHYFNVADQHHFDEDPAFQFDADPIFHFDADPNSRIRIQLLFAEPSGPPQLHCEPRQL